MTTHPYDTLALASGGQLIFTPCPGTQDVPLTTAVEQLQQAGARTLITLMPNAELEKFNAQALPDVCESLGINWYQLPVDDESGPGSLFEQGWQQHRPALAKQLASGQTIAIHCRGGSGRTGLMAAILLAQQGMALDEIISSVQAIRPKALRQSAQRAFLQHTMDR